MSEKGSDYDDDPLEMELKDLKRKNELLHELLDKITIKLTALEASEKETKQRLKVLENKIQYLDTIR